MHVPCCHFCSDCFGPQLDGALIQVDRSISNLVLRVERLYRRSAAPSCRYESCQVASGCLSTGRGMKPGGNTPSSYIICGTHCRASPGVSELLQSMWPMIKRRGRRQRKNITNDSGSSCKLQKSQPSFLTVSILSLYGLDDRAQESLAPARPRRTLPLTADRLEADCLISCLHDSCRSCT